MQSRLYSVSEIRRKKISNYSPQVFQFLVKCFNFIRNGAGKRMRIGISIVLRGNQ